MSSSRNNREQIGSLASKEASSHLDGLAIAAWERGLRWIVERLHYFRPADWRKPEELKESAELSLLYGHVFPLLPKEQQDAMAPIAQFLCEFLDRPLAQWVRRVPAHYNPYVVAYLPLRSVGVRLPAWEEAIARIRAAGFPEVLENVPYRVMELRHLTWKAGLGGKRPDWGPVYRTTAMRSGFNPVYYSIEDVYSVTHTLFYLTDFCGPRFDMPPAERRRAIEIVEPLLLHYWRKPDWDITAELLINLVSLEHYDTPLFAGALGAVANAWNDDGALPGPHFEEKDLGSPSLRFRHCYHTTLVGLILCAAYLHRTVWRGPHAAS